MEEVNLNMFEKLFWLAIAAIVMFAVVAIGSATNPASFPIARQSFYAMMAVLGLTIAAWAFPKEAFAQVWTRIRR